MRAFTIIITAPPKQTKLRTHVSSNLSTSLATPTPSRPADSNLPYPANKMAEAPTSNPANDNRSEERSYDHIPWPVRPSIGINYDFIVSMYLGGCGLALFFFTLEKQLLDPLLHDDNIDTQENDNAIEAEQEIEKEVDPWKEFAKGMQGMYFVFAPFALCLPWSLIVRYYWARETAKAAKDKKED